MTKKDNWENLKKFACPKCSNPLVGDSSGTMHLCSKCGFRIGVQRFNEIVSDMYTPKRPKEKDNQELLNNL